MTTRETHKRVLLCFFNKIQMRSMGLFPIQSWIVTVMFMHLNYWKQIDKDPIPQDNSDRCQMPLYKLKFDEVGHFQWDIIWYIYFIYAVYVFVYRLSSVLITKETRFNLLIVKCFVFFYSRNIAVLCRQTYMVLYIIHNSKKFFLKIFIQLYKSK